ncbi:hypothetical protein BCIN_11g05380 [Botrytis cinerea B05.10]|uniref:Uncharacterized protein n=1 Tax=Botryotinia fuckeliana (strain B05.10) TaxID=332648 RepID=A0A384JY29_BOTFB|nr:hypothetical protein BCIN_11g05380 [Botrytis cinerea B05.10]ATZ55264.1 hypothetical protein BCIN_11g05380 [Botrytis cinerea B05.10]
MYNHGHMREIIHLCLSSPIPSIPSTQSNPIRQSSYIIYQYPYPYPSSSSSSSIIKDIPSIPSQFIPSHFISPISPIPSIPPPLNTSSYKSNCCSSCDSLSD